MESICRFFNPELCFMDKDLLLERVKKEKRISSLEQVTDNLLTDFCDGFHFDWSYYIVKNSLNLNTREEATMHFIEEGFEKGLITNSVQEKEEEYSLEYGVNLFGYMGIVSGQGNSALAILESLRKLSINIQVNDVNCRIPALSINKRKLKSKYSINIFHINPDRADLYVRFKSFMRKRVNIAIWTWETETIPDYWKKYFKWFNEIWTISDFSSATISRASTIPVINIKPPLEIHTNPSNYGLEYIEKNSLSGKYIYFYCFDYVSYMDRKNPYALLEAYGKIQSDDNTLIIKTMNMPKEVIDTFSKPGVYIINEALSYDDYISLFSQIHCYVSPHRSEGQGRTIMEAMLLSKKVIVTAYSGNLDFTNVTNSYLIKWNYVTCNEPTIYLGNKWANPSVTHLTDLMSKSHDDFINGRCRMNVRAVLKIKEEFSYEACSSILKERLGRIENLK